METVIDPRRLGVRDAAVAAQLWGFPVTCRQMERLAGDRRLPFDKDATGRLWIAADQLRQGLATIPSSPQPRRGSKYR